MMSRAKSLARELTMREMCAYRAARNCNDQAKAWRALERAHIISQPYLALHIANHWEMLTFAMVERNGREVSGQLARLALAPLGAITGRIPIGNTGRSNVSAFKPMPVPDDIRRSMENVQN